MPRRKPIQDQEETALEPITPNQQTFIEHLLSGKNVSTSAHLAGISRRTATYWLADHTHPVYREYETQRAQRLQTFAARIANIHELALKAIEDALSPEAPATLRFQAAKMIYDAHLQRLCEVQQPRTPLALVKDQTEDVGDQEHFQMFYEHKMRMIPD